MLFVYLCFIVAHLSNIFVMPWADGALLQGFTLYPCWISTFHILGILLCLFELGWGLWFGTRQNYRDIDLNKKATKSSSALIQCWLKVKFKVDSGSLCTLSFNLGHFIKMWYTSCHSHVFTCILDLDCGCLLVLQLAGPGSLFQARGLSK